MNRYLPLCFVLAADLSGLPGTAALAEASPSPPAARLEMEQQVLKQGPMLLGNLRYARQEGLRRDPWGMSYSLREAQRMLYAIEAAERFIRSKDPAASGSPRTGTLPPALSAPLGQSLEVDRPEPGGRERPVARFDGRSGFIIPLGKVDRAIGRALAALNGQQPALGMALLATEDALTLVLGDKELEPADWASVRNQVLEVYALALDSRPETLARLAAAQRALAALPGGKRFARRLAGLRVGPAPDLDALSTLVQDLDVKVQSLRDAAEIFR